MRLQWASDYSFHIRFSHIVFHSNTTHTSKSSGNTRQARYVESIWFSSERLDSMIDFYNNPQQFKRNRDLKNTLRLSSSDRNSSNAKFANSIIAVFVTRINCITEEYLESVIVYARSFKLSNLKRCYQIAFLNATVSWRFRFHRNLGWFSNEAHQTEHAFCIFLRNHNVRTYILSLFDQAVESHC